MRVLAVISGCIGMICSVGSVYANEPTGIWLTDGGRSLVNVSDCEQAGAAQGNNGQAGKGQAGNGQAANGQRTGQPQTLPKSKRVLCSKIVWLKQPTYENGQPLVDRRNENPELRNRTIIGTPILLGLRFGEEGYWRGKVYNPEDGKTYAVYVAAEDKETLTVKGCATVLFSEVCRTKTWTRATQEMLASALPDQAQGNQMQGGQVPSGHMQKQGGQGSGNADSTANKIGQNTTTQSQNRPTNATSQNGHGQNGNGTVAKSNTRPVKKQEDHSSSAN